MKYSYVIIDNDTKSIERLHELFGKFPEFLCKGTAGNVDSAVDLILDKMPHLVFIDVEVPGQYCAISSFAVLHELKKYTDTLPNFVVVTKTDRYAIEAIKNDVLDYMLKPINLADLRKTVFRFEKKFGTKSETLCLRSYGDYRFIDMEDVLYLKADNNTTDFYMRKGKKVSAYKTLKHFAKTLPDHFVRIHNSYIINTKYVSRIHFGKAVCTVKDSNEMIPFSKSYKTNVEVIKNTLFGANTFQIR